MVGTDGGLASGAVGDADRVAAGGVRGAGDEVIDEGEKFDDAETSGARDDVTPDDVPAEVDERGVKDEVGESLLAVCGVDVIAPEVVGAVDGGVVMIPTT
ncbi:hypothetical protein ABIB25_000007 [Nakamurella sp. UYEF19]|uniref:hypothetical protein n=1 Tax=Nakamurella sp. UYEF19 TaxID=1756392 RepID=UPI00339897AC